jgi:hypothetical protein
MTDLFGLLHKHLVGSYLSALILLCFLLHLLDLRFNMIIRIRGLKERLSSSKPFLIAFFLSSFLILSFFADSILQRSPDHMYLFQAETFLKGRLWNNPPPQDFFTFHSIVTKDNKWLSRVFPGWSFLLGTSMFFHIPTWLLNPLLGTASLLVLFFLARLLYNSIVGLLSVLAVFCSPFFLFNASSYVPHISCGLLILLAVYFFCSFYIKKNPAAYVCWIGVCFGGAYLIRPFSTLCCLVPTLIALMIKRKGEFFHKDILYFMMGITPFLLINFLYNYLITGNFFLSPFNWSDPNDTIHFKLSIIFDNLNSLETQLLWMNPVIFITYFFMLIYLTLKRKIQSHEFFFLILIIGCFFYNAPGVSYGSRYYFEGYLLCVLTVIGRLSQFQDGAIKRLLTIALIGGFVSSFLLIPAYALHYKNKIYYQNELYRLVEEKHLSNAIVFMAPGAPPTTREARNDPDLQNNVLFVHDLKEKNAFILKYFPTRDFYRYNPEEKNEEQKLQRYVIPNSGHFPGKSIHPNKNRIDHGPTASSRWSLALGLILIYFILWFEFPLLFNVLARVLANFKAGLNRQQRMFHGETGENELT